MTIAYPAMFHKEKEGGYFVTFPDLPGCFSQGDTISEAIAMASDALGCYLASEELRPLPAPCDITALAVADGFVSMVSVDLDKFLDGETTVNKTVTIPKWLNDAASERGINFSAALRNALINQL